MIRLTTTFSIREANTHFNELTENNCQTGLCTQWGDLQKSGNNKDNLDKQNIINLKEGWEKETYDYRNKLYQCLIINVNGLKVPTKRKRLSSWKTKWNPIFCSQKTHLKYKDLSMMIVKGWESHTWQNINEKNLIYCSL